MKRNNNPTPRRIIPFLLAVLLVLATVVFM